MGQRGYQEVGHGKIDKTNSCYHQHVYVHTYPYIHSQQYYLFGRNAYTICFPSGANKPMVVVVEDVCVVVVDVFVVVAAVVVIAKYK